MFSIKDAYYKFEETARVIAFILVLALAFAMYLVASSLTAKASVGSFRAIDSAVNVSNCGDVK